MKKFIKNSLLSCIVLLISYPFFMVASSEIMPKRFLQNVKYAPASFGGYSFTRFQELNELESADLLFLGSSQTYRGFNTSFFDEKLGVKSFNMGSSAQTHLQTEALLKTYLKKLKPKLVVYEVYPEIFNNEGLESTLDLIANAQNNNYSLNLVFKQNKWLSYNTYLYALYDQRIKKSTYKENNEHSIGKYIKGGYVEKEGNYKRKEFKEKSWNYKSKQLEAFQRNVELLKKNGIEYILVWAPLTATYYNAYDNNDEHEKLIASYGDFYNFNVLIDLEENVDFLDKNHLNKNGVRKFNKALLHYLKPYFNN